MHANSPCVLLRTALAFSVLVSCASADPAAHIQSSPPAPLSSATSAPLSSATSAPPLVIQEDPPDPPVTAMLPVLTGEEFGSSRAPMGLFSVEGALVVSKGQQIGRIVGEQIQWIGSLPPGSQLFGDNVTVWVEGRWPDRIDVIFTSSNAKAPLRTYIPLTGKGTRHTPASEVGGGDIAGIATVGKSTLLLTFSVSVGGGEIVTVRGPTLARKQLSGKEAGCTDEERFRSSMFPDLPGLFPEAFGATSGGTLVAIGDLCEARGAAAEIWDAKGTSRIVDLHYLWSSVQPAGTSRILKGTGDDLWIFVSGWDPIVHFHEGRFDALPMLATRVENVFLSARGQLHVSDGRVIHRLEGNTWVSIAHFAQPTHFQNLVMDGDRIWGQAAGVIYRFREGAAARVETSCAEPFVFLGEVVDLPEPSRLQRMLPEVQKSLSSFPDSAKTRFVEFPDGFQKRMGIAVPRRAVGEALIAHLKADVKALEPRLTCFAPKPEVKYHHFSP